MSSILKLNTMIENVPSLCESCSLRGIVTNINPTSDTSVEEILQYFCKSPTLYNNRKPFYIPVYDSQRDDVNGNLVILTSQIVNCSEYVFMPSSKITNVTYDGTSLTVAYNVIGTNGAYNLDIYSFDTMTIIKTVSAVSNGNGTTTFTASVANGQPRYFVKLSCGAIGSKQSNIFTLNLNLNPAAMLSTSEVIYDSVAPSISVTYSLQGFTGSDTLNIYAQHASDTPILLHTATVTTNQITTITVVTNPPIPLAANKYNIYCKLMTANILSNNFPITVS